MAITSELLGRLGGKVERVPVSVPEVGEATELMKFSFPAGQTFLVGAIGKCTKQPGLSTSYPVIKVTGREDVKPDRPRSQWGATGIVSGDAEITFVPRGGATLAADFSGEIFWARVS